MVFRRFVLMTVATGLFISVNACGTDRMAESNSPSSYGQRGPYDPQMQRRPLGPWDLRQNQQQLGPSTWYGCPQQSPRCFPE